MGKRHLFTAMESTQEVLSLDLSGFCCLFGSTRKLGRQEEEEEEGGVLIIL